MYICPTCSKGFETESDVVKHFLSCWKEQHPVHVSKSAPRSADISTRVITDDIASFFNSFN